MSFEPYCVNHSSCMHGCRYCHRLALLMLDQERAQKDRAYRQRNRVVALLAAKVLNGPVEFSAGLGRHAPDPDPDWDSDWRNIIFIDLQAGQVSFHIHDSELPLFSRLPRYERPWDGHTDEEKWARVEREFRNLTWTKELEARETKP